MAYVWLALAVLTDVAATVGLRATNGFAAPVPSVVVLAGFGLSILFLSWSVVGLPLIVVYALFSGLGGAGVAVLAALVYGEHPTVAHFGGLALIIGGTILLTGLPRA